MRTYFKIRFILVGLAIALFTGCNASRESATIEQAEQDLVELRNWIGNKLDRAATATADERAVLRSEFNELTARIDRGVDNLAEESKEEYKELRNRFNEWDTEQARLEEERQNQQNQSAMDPAREREWTIQLMGTSFENINNVPADQIDEAYVAFMQSVRDKDGNWGDTEWQYAQAVLDRLKERKHQLGSALSTEDRLKVEALEAEFGTRKAASDVKEEIKN